MILRCPSVNVNYTATHRRVPTCTYRCRLACSSSVGTAVTCCITTYHSGHYVGFTKSENIQTGYTILPKPSDICEGGKYIGVSWITTRCVAPRSVCVLPRYLCKKLGLGSVLKHLCEVHLSCIHIGNMWRVIANGPNWGIEAVKLRTPRTQLKQHRDEKTWDGDTPIYGKPTLNGVCCDCRHFGPLCIPFRTMKMKSDVISAHV